MLSAHRSGQENVLNPESAFIKGKDLPPVDSGKLNCCLSKVHYRYKADIGFHGWEERQEGGKCALHSIRGLQALLEVQACRVCRNLK